MSFPHFFSAPRGLTPWGAWTCLMLTTLVMGCPPDFQDDTCQVNSDCFEDESCQAGRCVADQTAVPTVSTFTASPETITSGQSVTLQWSMVDVQSATVSGGDFSLEIPEGDLGSGSATVSVDETTTFTLVAVNGALTDEATAIVTVEEAMVPVITSFEADASPVDPGTTVTLSWASTGATSGRIDYDDQSIALEASALDSGTQEVMPSEDTSYTLVLTNDTGDAEQVVEVEVNVGLPEVTSFTGPQTPINVGSSAALSWEVSGAQTLALVDDQGVAVDISSQDVASGSVMVSPEVTTTYTLSATNAAGTTTQDAVVVVNEILGVTAFAASPDTVSTGQAVTLSWTLTGAPTAVTLTSDLPETIDLTGVADVKDASVVVTPTRDTVYTLTITDGSTTETRTATVTVLPDAPTISQFDASPNAVSVGGVTTLIWQVDGATQLSLVDGLGTVVDVSSKSVVSDTIDVTVDANTTYTLSATNAGGTVSQDVTVVVGDLVTITSFAPSQAAVTTGDPVTLSWNVANAMALSLTDQDNQIISLAGKSLNSDSIDIVPTSSTSTYTLVAQGFGGPVSAVATVTVNPLMASITSFAADDTDTTSGQPVTLTWVTEQTTGLTLQDDQGRMIDISALMRDGDSVSVSPQVTTTYTLTATDGTNSPSQSVTITVGAAPLLITEVLANPTGVNDQREWIEIHNTGNTFVDLSQYSVAVGGADWTAGQVLLSGTIAPQGCVVVGGPTSDVDNGAPVFDVAADFTPDLGDGGATASGVALFFGTSVGALDNPIDAVVYGDANANMLRAEDGMPKADLSPTPGVGESLVRTSAASDTFALDSTPSPGNCFAPVNITSTRALNDVAGSVTFNAYGVDLALMSVMLGSQTLSNCVATTPEQFTCDYAAGEPSGAVDLSVTQTSEYVDSSAGAVVLALATARTESLDDAFFFEGRIADPGVSFYCGLSDSTLTQDAGVDATLNGELFLAGFTDAWMPLPMEYRIEMATFAPGTLPYEDNSIAWMDASFTGALGNNWVYSVSFSSAVATTLEGAMRVSPNGGQDYYYCDTNASNGSDNGYAANGGTSIVWTTP